MPPMRCGRAALAAGPRAAERRQPESTREGRTGSELQRSLREEDCSLLVVAEARETAHKLLDARKAAEVLPGDGCCTGYPEQAFILKGVFK